MFQRELEKRCPQIAGEDIEIWRKFIKRDILNWEKKLQEPSNPKSWSKVYRVRNYNTRFTSIIKIFSIRQANFIKSYNYCRNLNKNPSMSFFNRKKPFVLRFKCEPMKRLKILPLLVLN